MGFHGWHFGVNLNWHLTSVRKPETPAVTCFEVITPSGVTMDITFPQGLEWFFCCNAFQWITIMLLRAVNAWRELQHFEKGYNVFKATKCWTGGTTLLRGLQHLIKGYNIWRGYNALRGATTFIWEHFNTLGVLVMVYNFYNGYCC